jgi:hypothetical protein
MAVCPFWVGLMPGLYQQVFGLFICLKAKTLCGVCDIFCKDWFAGVNKPVTAENC